MRRLIGRLLWWFVRPEYEADQQAETAAALAYMNQLGDGVRRSMSALGRQPGKELRDE